MNASKKPCGNCTKITRQFLRNPHIRHIHFRASIISAMNNSAEIVYGRASPEDLPAVVELCMMVEAQHEEYWALRWQRRPGLNEGYLGWPSRRLNEPRMLI